MEKKTKIREKKKKNPKQTIDLLPFVELMVTLKNQLRRSLDSFQHQLPQALRNKHNHMLLLTWGFFPVLREEKKKKKKVHPQHSFSHYLIWNVVLGKVGRRKILKRVSATAEKTWNLLKKKEKKITNPRILFPGCYYARGINKTPRSKVCSTTKE